MHENRASISKRTGAVISEVIQRERLFRQLDGLTGSMVWIGGPGGSGKTTLMASWLASKKMSNLWYRLDEGDADLPSFFYHMGLALQLTLPTAQEPLPLLTPEYMFGIPTFTKNYFEELYSRLNSNLPDFPDPSFVIVLDNYQDVPIDSGFHAMLRKGLEATPKNIKVVVLSRHEMPPELTDLRETGKAAYLGWEALRFTLDESRAFVRLRALDKQDITEDTLLQIYRKTDGWVTGLILIMELTRQTGFLPKELKTTVVAGEIFEYFLSEILKATDTETKDFLLKTALLPDMTPWMAEELTGHKNAHRILSRLERNHFFLTRPSLQAAEYQYHQLFRELLLLRANLSFAPEQLLELRKRAAGILIRAGHIEAAATLFIEAGDWDGLIPLILTNAPGMVAQGRNSILDKWLKSLPSESLESAPWLLFWSGACSMTSNLVESRVCFEKALKLFAAEDIEDINDHTTGALLAWSGIIDAIFLANESFKNMDRWIDWLDNLMGDKLSFPAREVEFRVVSSMVTAIMQRRPNHNKAEIWFQRARSLVMADGYANEKLGLGISLIISYIFNGRFREAAFMLDTLRPVMDTPETPGLAQIGWCFLEATCANLAEPSEEICFSAAQKGLELAHKTGIHVYDFYLQAQIVHGAFLSSDLNTAEGCLNKLKPMLEVSGLLNRSNYYYMKGWLSLLKEDFPAAMENFLIGLHMAEEIGNPLIQLFHHVGAAQAFFESHERQKAKEHLALANTIAADVHFKGDFLLLTSKAQFAFDSGNEQEGLEALTRMMKYGRENRFFNIPFWRPSVMSRLCLKALEAGIEQEYVQELIRKRRLLPPEATAGLDTWPWPVKIYTLGGFELLLDGKPARFAGKAKKKPLELLKALTAFGGRNVAYEQLLDLLWPEADGDSAFRSFEMALNRLRHLIGKKTVQYQSGLLTLDDTCCRLDTWAFEELCEIKGTDNKMAKKAVSIYKGHFLPEEQNERWPIDIRARLKLKFIRLINRLGSSYEAAGLWKEAVENYEYGLELEPTQEDFYRSIIQVNARLNRRSEAISAYNRCYAMLETTMGLKPAAETEAVYAELLNQKKCD